MRLTQNLQIMLGALTGVGMGLLLRPETCPAEIASPLLFILHLLGQIFINLLKMILVPLIFASIAAGVAALRTTLFARQVWPVMMGYFALTTALAAATGLIMSNIFKPGTGLSSQLFYGKAAIPAQDMPVAAFIKQFIDGIFVNPVSAMASGNVLAVVVFAIFIGIGFIVLGERARTLIKVTEELFDLTMAIVGWIMRLAPLGIMGLLATLVGSQDLSLFPVMGKFIVVVLATTLFHGLVTLPLILWCATAMCPWHFLKSVREAMLTAIATSSSNATLPVSLRCATDNLKIDASVSRVVLPIGATINMDGTALYEAMAALFVANLCGLDLNLLQQIMVGATAMLASVGAPGIPSAGMVTMIMVLQSVGLPIEAVALLLPIDRPLDTLRTAVNVEGDLAGACIVQKLVKV
jgi:Na+/H+-dicarboxylate symporter